MNAIVATRKSAEMVTYRRMTPAQRKARVRQQRIRALVCLWYSLVTSVRHLPAKTYRLALDLMARVIVLCLFVAGMMLAFGALYGALWFWCNAPWMIP